jgi:hypothetical protein
MEHFGADQKAISDAGLSFTAAKRGLTYVTIVCTPKAAGIWVCCGLKVVIATASRNLQLKKFPASRLPKIVTRQSSA